MSESNDISDKLDDNQVKKDCGSLLFYALVGGYCIADFATSVANYQAQAGAITQKIYSAAQTITPEVVKQANDLIAQVADKPNYIEAMVGILFGGLIVNVAVDLATIINQQRQKQKQEQLILPSSISRGARNKNYE
jgi:hypothetical protein